MHNSRIKGDVCTEEKKEKLKAQKLNKKKRKRRNSESRPHSKQQLKNGTADNRPWDIIDFYTHQNQLHHLCEQPPLILHRQTINTMIIHDWTTVKSGADNSPTKSDTKNVTKVTLNLKEVVVGIMIGNDL